jgi:hypothetical protein
MPKKDTLLYRVSGSIITRQLRDPWALGFGETMTVLCGGGGEAVLVAATWAMVSVAMVLVTRTRSLFGEDGGFQFLDPRGMLVELRLNDLIEAAVDGGKSVMHLFA